jgi:hypothetical protein
MSNYVNVDTNGWQENPTARDVDGVDTNPIGRGPDKSDQVDKHLIGRNGRPSRQAPEWTECPTASEIV